MKALGPAGAVVAASGGRHSGRRRRLVATAALSLAGCGTRMRPLADAGEAACTDDPPLRSALRAALPDDALDVPMRPATTDPLSGTLAAALDAMLQRATDRLDAAAIDAAVIVPGRGLWQGRVGWADRPGRRRVDARTEFWWASCGKAVTASLVLRAEQAGLLSRVDPLDRWFGRGAWPARTRVLDLLRHTSTLLSYNHPSLRFDPTARYARPDQLLDRVRPHGLAGCPGQRFSYSNTNYLLLALLLEQVWGQPFHVLVQAQLADPLGLRLRALQPAEQPAALALAHHRDGHAQRLPGLSSLLGAGDIVGGAADWVRFWEALLQGRVAGPAAPRWAQLLDMELPNPDSRSWYGLGVMALDWRDAQGRDRLWLAHTGGAQDGSNAIVLWDPLVRAYAAVAVNSAASAAAVANALQAALESAGEETPPRPTAPR